MTENHQGHEVTITTKQGVSMSKTQKTSLIDQLPTSSLEGLLDQIIQASFLRFAH